MGVPVTKHIPMERESFMKYSNLDHTFAVCAYKESAYLEELLESLNNQTVKTNIIIATSTPNGYIENLAQRYNVPVYVNEGEKGISGDWNFAVRCVKTPLVTIAHQDDIYEPGYAEAMLKAMNHAKRPLIAFSHYAELRNGEKVYSNRLLTIKKILLLPIKLSSNSIFMRRRSLSMGNAICCPAVTYVTEIALQHPFQSNFACSLDWQQWEILSKIKGTFAFVDEPLMCHRIHEESTTSEILGDNKRTIEDYQMFCKFWPKPIAKMLTKFYSSSEKSNDL